jgi:hypothetical protein
MAAVKSNRARSTRARVSKRSARRKRGSKVRPLLDEALGQFNEVLALAETICQTFEAALERGEWEQAGAYTIALRHAVNALQNLYRAFDLAILGVDS